MSITLRSSAALSLDVLDPPLEFESDEVGRSREQSWFAPTPLGSVVLRHREGEEILRARRFELGGERFLDNLGVTGGPLYDMWMAALFSVPVRDHAFLRGLVNRSFVPGVLEGLRPFIRGLGDRLAGGVPIDKDCEFVTAFADPFAARVMCEMLGVPPEDYDEFHRCSNDVALALSRNDGPLPRIEVAIVELSEYVRSLLSDRRRHLGDDLISSLILAERTAIGSPRTSSTALFYSSCGPARTPSRCSSVVGLSLLRSILTNGDWSPSNRSLRRGPSRRSCGGPLSRGARCDTRATTSSIVTSSCRRGRWCSSRRSRRSVTRAPSPIPSGSTSRLFARPDCSRSAGESTAVSGPRPLGWR